MKNTARQHCEIKKIFKNLKTTFLSAGTQDFMIEKVLLIFPEFEKIEIKKFPNQTEEDVDLFVQDRDYYLKLDGESTFHRSIDQTKVYIFSK